MSADGVLPLSTLGSPGGGSSATHSQETPGVRCVLSGAPQGLIPCGSETGLTSSEAAQSAEHTAALCLGRGEGTLQPVSGGGGSFACPLALAELSSSLWDTSSMASSPSGWVLSKIQGKNPQNKTKLNLLKVGRNRDPRALLEGMGNEGPRRTGFAFPQCHTR